MKLSILTLNTTSNNHSDIFFQNFDIWFLIIYLQTVSDAMLVELKQCFMEAYDDNRDGKISVVEVGGFTLVGNLSLKLKPHLHSKAEKRHVFLVTHPLVLL